MSRVAELENYVCTLYDTRDQLTRHIYSRADAAFAKGDSDRDSIRDLHQLRARQAQMKEAFAAAIGGLPETNPPLHARTVNTVQGSGYRVENVIFQARPGHYVTANLYLPDGCGEPGAAVLFHSGHEYEGKHSAYYHQVCLRFVQAGLIVLAIDPVGQGERLSFCESQSADGAAPVWGTQEHQLLGIQCYSLGDSVARYFVHDSIRAIDYLCSRQEVDPARIGVTGNSGGGTQTAMLMVCDERIAAAAPATFIMNRQSYMHAGGVQDAEQVWPGLTAAGFDHEDLLLSFAPKPLMVLAVEYDFFPIEATRRTVTRCRRFWEMHGRSDELQLIEDRSTHYYTDKMALAAAAFFAKQLAGRGAASTADSPPLQPLAAKQLWCTTSGQAMLELPDAQSVQHVNAARYAELQQLRQALPPEKQQAQAEQAEAWLRGKVHASRELVAFNSRCVKLGEAEGLQVEYRLWWSQAGVMNSGYFFAAVAGADVSRQPVTVGLWPGGTRQLASRWSWIKGECAKGRTVLVLNCSGMGPHEPYPIYGKPASRFFGVLHKLADELLWLGDSLAALRTYDVLRCLDALEHWGEWQSSEVDFYTEGQHRLYVQLAGLLDRRVAAISGDDSLPRSMNWVDGGKMEEEEEAMSAVLPGLFRYFGLPELTASFPGQTPPGKGVERR
ncbi:hypothetical protein EBB07_34075 [Paenibacillaceae bacterium]|nr:hypothetical protein EBB07_34075 [Paenibacillaceae bacterium]